jgi:hypothetical protein
MPRFDVSRVGKRVRGTLASPWQLGTDTRSVVLAFGAGLFVGAAIGAYLGFGPLRALAAKASERARGQAFVALSEEPEPALAGSTRNPEQDLEGRPG